MSTDREWTIRKAEPRDLGTVRRCVEAAYRGYEETIGVSPGPLYDDYNALIQSGNVWACEDRDGNLAGILVMFFFDDYVLLDNAAVFPEWQLHGIASKFQEFGIKKAREHGIRKMRLYTNQKMAHLVQGYKDRGWTEIERKKEAGYDRVYMEKAI